MTQEEKQLLLIDLCARLPNGVKSKSQASHLEINTIDGYFVDGDGTKMFHLSEPDFWQEVEHFQYYLRPMSSMTAEEEYEYHQCKNLDYLEICEMKHTKMLETTALCFSRAIDWLNSRHFDYRGLIEGGLVLEAPKDMYKIN